MASSRGTDLAFLRRLLRTAEAPMRRAFLRAVIAAENGVPLTRVADLLASGRIDEAIDAVPWRTLGEPMVRDQIVRTLRDTLEASGIHAARAIPEASFSIVDARPTEWVRERGARLVVEIDADQRAGLRATLADGLGNGRSPLQLARDVKAQVGLHTRWIEAVSNFSADLDGKVGPKDHARQVARYSAQLRQARALSIARTEAAAASMAGRTQAWEQAAEQGLFEPSTATLTWVMVQREHVDADPCPDLDGQTVPYGESFTWDGGVAEPPLHTNCLCTLRLNL